MKSKPTFILRPIALSWLALAAVALVAAVATAQQPTATKVSNKAEAKTESPVVETPEDAGDYTVISRLEFGYRGLRVGGDLN